MQFLHVIKRDFIDQRCSNFLFQSAVKGERRRLGKLYAIERGGDQAEIIAGLAHQVSGNTHVVGITGAPGQENQL